MSTRKTLQEIQNLPAEALKSFSELLQADPRYADYILFGENDGSIQYTLTDHYERVALLQPPRNAPQEVVSAFVTAQHLCIFSWFNYPLSSLAEVQAYFSLELALRKRMHEAPAPGLKARLAFAVSKGWIKPAELLEPESFLTAESRRNFLNRHKVSRGNDYLKHLADQLPRERNWLAHGNFSPGTDAFMTLDVVSQLLEQTYQDA